VIRRWEGGKGKESSRSGKVAETRYWTYICY
jgi:hypothetical protein